MAARSAAAIIGGRARAAGPLCGFSRTGSRPAAAAAGPGRQSPAASPPERWPRPPPRRCRNVLVLVRLHLLELVEALRLVDEGRVRVLPVVGGRLQLARLEHVLDALERHGDEPRVVAAARGGVGDGPGRLLLDVELGRGEQVHEGRDDVGLDHRLDLLARARGDVGDGPTGLLADALLRAVEQCEQPRQRAAVEHALRLVVVAGDDVARGAQRRRLHRGRRVAHEGDHARANARVQDGLDLLVGPVGEVAQRPAGVGEHLVVVGEDELREHGEGGRHHGPRRLRLAAAEVGQRPRGVAQHRHLRVRVELLEQRLQSALRQDQVPALR
eukprot:scaffold25122_cov66-Phaeocystis_antarctica.AAC.1